MFKTFEEFCVQRTFLERDYTARCAYAESCAKEIIESFVEKGVSYENAKRILDTCRVELGKRVNRTPLT